MVRFLEGHDEYRLSRRLASLSGRSRLADVAEQSRAAGAHVARYDLAVEEDRGKFLEAVRTDNLFSESGLFIVAGVWEQAKYVLELLKNTSILDDREKELVFWYRGDPPASAGAKSLRTFAESKKLKTEVVSALTPTSLQLWIQDEANGHGVSIMPGAITALLETINIGGYQKKEAPDTWRIHEEIEKLANYCIACGRKDICVEDVAILVHGTDALSIFELIDNFARGDKKSSLIALARALDRGDDPYYIFSMMVRQFRMLTRIKGAHKGMGDPAKELGVHPFAAKKAVEQARRLELGSLIVKLNKLRDIEIASKSGESDIVTGLYSFLFTL
jgi:DNA polymerase III delta subunit